MHGVQNSRFSRSIAVAVSVALLVFGISCNKRESGSLVVDEKVETPRALSVEVSEISKFIQAPGSLLNTEEQALLSTKLAEVDKSLDPSLKKQIRVTELVKGVVALLAESAETPLDEERLVEIVRSALLALEHMGLLDDNTSLESVKAVVEAALEGSSPLLGSTLEWSGVAEQLDHSVQEVVEELVAATLVAEAMAEQAVLTAGSDAELEQALSELSQGIAIAFEQQTGSPVGASFWKTVQDTVSAVVESSVPLNSALTAEVNPTENAIAAAVKEVSSSAEGAQAILNEVQPENADSPVAETPAEDAGEEAASYSLGGSISGLRGSLTLSLNGEHSLVVGESGPFAFEQKLDSGAAYLVSVTSQPSEDHCVITAGAGVVAAAHVTSVVVLCLPRVLSLYPTHGSEWLSWVGVANSVIENTSGNDIACNPTQNSHLSERCTNGGLRKYVRISGETDCSLFTAQDALDVFNWQCLTDGDDLVMVSAGFKSDSLGLADLIDFEASAFQDNNVSVSKSGSEVFSTVAEAWWGNPVVTIADSSVTELDQEGTVYLIRNDGADQAYLLFVKASGVSLVTEPGKTPKAAGIAHFLNFDNSSGSTHSGFWFEARFDSNGTDGLSFYNAPNVVIRNTYVENTSGTGLNVDGASSVWLAGFTAKDTAAATTNVGVKVGGTARVEMENLSVLNGEGSGVHVVENAIVKIENSLIDNPEATGVRAENSANLSLRNTTVRNVGPTGAFNNESSGIYLVDTVQATLENLTLHSNSDSGLDMLGEAQATWSNGSAFSNESAGITISGNGASSFTASDLDVSQNAFGLIASSVTNLTVRNSSFRENTSSGLSFNATGQLSVSDSTFLLNAGTGLQVSAPGSTVPVLLSGNKTLANGGFGLLINTSGVVVHKHRSVNNVAGGIMADGDGGIVTQFEVAHNGIGVISRGDNWVFTNGVSLNNLSAGFMSQSSAFDSVSSVAFFNNANFGVRAGYASSWANILAAGSDLGISFLSGTPLAQQFYGHLAISAPTPTDACTKNGGATIPTMDFTNGDCEPVTPGDWTVSRPTDLTGTFVGPVSSDSEHPDDFSAGSLASTSITDWLTFENLLRMIGLDHAANGDGAARGHCSGGVQCSILDLSLQPADTIAQGVIPSPLTGSPGDHVLSVSGRHFLMGATEDMAHPSGNKNGLCESNEHCVLRPDLWTFQDAPDAAKNLEGVFNHAPNHTNITLYSIAD